MSSLRRPYLWLFAISLFLSNFLLGCSSEYSGFVYKNSDNPTVSENQNTEVQTDDSTRLHGQVVAGRNERREYQLYVVDSGSLFRMGRKLASGTTDSWGKFETDGLEKIVDNWFLLQVDRMGPTNKSIYDIANRVTPLFTVVSKEQLEKNTVVYATPLSTLAYFVADNLYTDDANFQEILNQASALVISQIGFGLDKTTDLFTSPPVLLGVDDQDFVTSIKLRKANEALAALASSISAEQKLSFFEVLRELAKDISDGEMNGRNSVGTPYTMMPVDDFEQVVLGVELNALNLVQRPEYKIYDVRKLMYDEAIEQNLPISELFISVPNSAVQLNALSPDSDRDGVADIRDKDDDQDGVFDELDAFPLDPTEFSDLDKDGVGDNKDNDADGDGLTREEEIAQGTSDLDADSDGDGLLDGQEVIDFKTNPLSPDSDADGMSDHWELVYALNPTDKNDAAQDSDGDGFSNKEEYFLGGNPLDKDVIPQVGEWSTYQGGIKHTGMLAYTVDDDAVSSRWTASPFVSESLSNAVAAEGRVYLSRQSGIDGRSLVAIDAVNGRKIWEKRYPKDVYMGAPSYSNGRVMVVTSTNSNDYLKVFDAADGSLLKKITLSEKASYGTRSVQVVPAVDEYFFTDRSGSVVYASSMDKIESDWVHRFDETTVSMPTLDRDYLYFFANGVLPKVVVMSRTSGEVLYSTGDWTNAKEKWDQSLAPVLGPMNNILGILDGDLVNFDFLTQKTRWRVSGSFSRSIVLVNGLVFAIDSDALRVIDELTGDTLWYWEPDSGLPLIGNVAAARNVLFVQDSGQTYMLDIEKRDAIWQYPASGKLSMDAAGSLYIASDDGALHAVNLIGDHDGDGIPAWWESMTGLSDSNADDAAEDLDQDGLDNHQEFTLGTLPYSADIDGDNLSDAEELLEFFTSPFNADSDLDGLGDGEEVLLTLTNPLLKDSDGDGVGDMDEHSIFDTDPNDPLSLPDAISTWMENFEGETLPATWSQPIVSQAGWRVESGGGAGAGANSLRAVDVFEDGDSAIQFKGLFLAGEMTFYYKLINDKCCALLKVFVDGVQVGTANKTSYWSFLKFPIKAGYHTIEWRFSRLGSAVTESSQAWLDNISFDAY
ncbi:MAG: PQQ-binding-like beta-propeller repeat protein [Gammaproteobacteria bacterium]|nr:PQQ-binding-like beta-propeller repeat protein [Gammaproteobacteria bacterium]